MASIGEGVLREVMRGVYPPGGAMAYRSRLLSKRSST